MIITIAPLNKIGLMPSKSTFPGAKIRLIASPVKIGRYKVHATVTAAKIKENTSTARYCSIYSSTFFNVSFCLVRSYFFFAAIFMPPFLIFDCLWLSFYIENHRSLCIRCSLQEAHHAFQHQRSFHHQALKSDQQI